MFADYKRVSGAAKKQINKTYPLRAEKLEREAKRAPGRVLFEPEMVGLTGYRRVRPSGDDWLIPLRCV